jgi:hypothetical protein
VTEDTVAGLSELANEFGCPSLKHKVSMFMSSPEHKICALEKEVERMKKEILLLRRWTAPCFDSEIISDFPSIFDEFRQKQIKLLWRGSEDGFGAQDFHKKCDNHANTLTVIEDTNGNIFGGFTPETWESRPWYGKQGTESNTWKCDESGRGFVFTLRNPHNVSARIFRLRADKKQFAMICAESLGPGFGNCFVISNESNVAKVLMADFGEVYTNDTGMEGKTLFTGADTFIVNKIEVFEIIDANGAFRHLTCEVRKLDVLSQKTQKLLSDETKPLKRDISILKSWIVPRFDSEIIADFPSIFDRFRGKQIQLLWRGSRDGFGAQYFHTKCDKHANTLTLIQDTKRNIFGGFTTEEWDPLPWNGKKGVDDNSWKSGESFLFTLRNPYRVPARIFRLRTEKKHCAIRCRASKLPAFGGCLFLSNDGTGACGRTFDFNTGYINDTGTNGKTFFTGGISFTVAEIEVFEISDH